MNIYEWNRRLVDAIFHDRVNVSREIRRINATDNFLADAGGFDDGASAKASFLAAMPKTENGVRGLFSANVIRNWSPNHDELPFYTQLHLTIIAASADESLQDQGNFRIRLAQLLDLEPKDYVSTGCLPTLWRYAELWSESRASRIGDTRRLILPDVGMETIIGYSKQLAFPGFRDQNRLAELFTQTKIDSSSSLSEFMNMFHRNLRGFSDRFREEFDHFARLLEIGDKRTALETAFWDAVVETTWTRERSSRHKISTGCRLEIDPTDPYDLGMWIYCQGQDYARYGWQMMPNDKLSENQVGWIPKEGASVGSIIDTLISIINVSDQRSLIGNRLTRSLSEGCIGFAQDDDGRWLDVPSLTDSGLLWLMLHEINSWLVDALVDHGVDETVYRAPLIGSAHWTLVGPIDLYDEIRDWLEVNASSLDFFSPRLITRRIKLAGSIRRSDGAYLFLPPIVPIFRCDDAKTGIVILENQDQSTSHELKYQNGEFTLPEAVYDDNGHNVTMRVILYDEAGLDLAHSRYKFRNVSSALVFKKVRSPAKWLESGINGKLQEYTPYPIWREDNSVELSLSQGNIIRPLSRIVSSLDSPIRIEPERLDVRWLRTIEILSAIFARRYAYSIKECVTLLREVWDPQYNAWERLNDLIENGVLRIIHARHWSSSVIVACHPVIVIHQSHDSCTLRIVGLLSVAMRAIVYQVFGERCCIVASPDKLTGGALECKLVDGDEISTLHQETGWLVHRWSELPAFDLPVFKDLFEMNARTSISGYPDEDKAIWSTSLGLFVTDSSVNSDTPRLERWRTARQQDLYVLYRSDGAVWNTDCRRWALLAFAADQVEGIGSMFPDGTIRLNEAYLALPTQIAWCTVAAGGGVCFRDSEGKLLYSASDHWPHQNVFANWIGSTRRTRREPRDRYMLLLEKERRARSARKR